MTLEQKLKDAVWIAHSLFERGKTSGSSANLSFLHDGRIYITASGTCFGTLTSDDFAVVSLLGERLNSMKACRQLYTPTALMPSCGRAASLPRTRKLFHLTRRISE